MGAKGARFIIDYHTNGDLDFFAGIRDGEIYYSRIEGSNVQHSWIMDTNNTIGQDFGVDAIPIFIDIKNDTGIDFFVGNLKGGSYL